ncbi:UNVERIFIED_CONTAM: hypothetical protein Sradi_6225100 [Sesamum radiatum]|uniref:Reverse transcriptase zinc-binding domain-containing protein n=1 Tax=Sesamum radiatum TaxID=300843 RepID=A0AAW2KA07_SESRA
MEAGGWNFIWKAKVQPKTRLFAWRCCRNALPACSRLRTRGIRIEDECLNCDQVEDGLEHILRRCSFARLVWALSHLPWKVIARDDLSTEDWLRYIHSRMDAEGFERFLVISWLLWNNRNSRLFEGRVLDAKSLVDQAFRSLRLQGL